MFFSVGAQPYTRPGVTSTWTCPPAPAGKPLPKVLGGTNDDHGHSSRLCAAAVHAGKITTDKSGTFTIVVEEASAKYVGTTANGIAGEDGNKFSGSGFGFELPAAPMAVRWSEDKWRNVFEVYPTAGETKTFSCAAATDQDKKRPGDVIGGSDEYAEWSSLCWAAVHEGAEKGSKEYKGSTANGMTSKDGKSSDRFSFGLK